MPELLQRISSQLTEWWGRFSNKQRIAIISTVAVAVIALAVLVVVLNQPNFVLLEDNLSPSEVNERTALLESAADPISYSIQDGGTSIYVEASQKTKATLALAAVGIITAQDMTYQEAFNNGITTSNREAAQKAKLFFQAEIARTLELISQIDDASVTIVLPDTDSAIFQDQAESKASILLTTNEDLSDSMVEAIAKAVADMVENLETSNISIIDNNARLLYNGEVQGGVAISAVGGAEYEINQELMVQDKIRRLLLSGGEYNDAIVVADLSIDFDQLERTTEMHTTQDGSNKGLLDMETYYNSTGENTDASGSPGTDSNGVTDTLTNSAGSTSSNVEQYEKDYIYDTTITKEIKAIGGAKYDESSVTVTLNKYEYFDQAIEEAKAARGDQDAVLLNMTWDEFKLSKRNEGNVKITDVDPDIASMIKNASNIDNVIVQAYVVPKFIEKDVEKSQVSDYLLIGIIVLMILLLGYAVYKGTEPVEIKELEPELSVEDLLTTTKEQAELETIEFDGKSDARVQIEQFVENNPDAVALLLRNWLNEDWE